MLPVSLGGHRRDGSFGPDHTSRVTAFRTRSSLSPRSGVPSTVDGPSRLERGRSLMRGLRELASEKPLRMRVVGECMAPLVRDGEIVELAPARFYWPGDVIAFRQLDGTLVLHRVIGYRPRLGRLQLITKGDNGPSWDAALAMDQVIGKVCGGACSPLLVAVPFRHRLRTVLRFLGPASVRILRRFRRSSD